MEIFSKTVLEVDIEDKEAPSGSCCGISRCTDSVIIGFSQHVGLCACYRLLVRSRTVMEARVADGLDCRCVMGVLRNSMDHPDQVRSV